MEALLGVYVGAFVLALAGALLCYRLRLLALNWHEPGLLQVGLETSVFSVAIAVISVVSSLLDSRNEALGPIVVFIALAATVWTGARSSPGPRNGWGEFRVLGYHAVQAVLASAFFIVPILPVAALLQVVDPVGEGAVMDPLTAALYGLSLGWPFYVLLVLAVAGIAAVVRGRPRAGEAG